MGCAPSHPQLMGGTDAFDAKDIVLVVNKKAYNVSQFTQIMGAAAKISVKDSSFQSGGTLDKESVAFALRLMECDSAKGDEGVSKCNIDQSWRARAHTTCPIWICLSVSFL